MKHDTPRATCLALAAALVAGPGAAQNRSVGEELADGVRDILHVWGSPFHASGEDLQGILVVGGLAGATLALDQPVHDWLASHPHSVPVLALGPFRESSPISLLGRTKLLLPMSATMYLAGVVVDSEELRDAGLGCAGSNVATTLARTMLTRVIGRERPQTGGGPYAFRPLTFEDWDMRSFPGGHAANIMSCASYWNHRFDLGAAEPLLYVLAGSIGVGRVVDGAHWLSDTAVGLSWGFSVGKAIAARMKRRADEPADRAEPAAVLIWSIRF